jgi:uncharacterized protein involved in exopolysaccharide biosynthesis
MSVPQLPSSSLSVVLPSGRDVVRPIFRYRRAALWTFAFVVAMTATIAALLPRVYQADMTILVKRERVDPIMSTNDRNPAPPSADITETELFSEVELLRSRDLLARVVADTGLSRAAVEEGSTPAAAEAAAVAALRDELEITPVRRTTLIAVSYRSPDAELAARVLEQLAARYLEKHLAVHRPAGAHEFFTEQAARLQQELRAAEERLRDFTAREGVVAAASQKASVLQRLSAFETALAETEASMADATRRLASVRDETAATPDRQVTQVRDGGNVELLRELRSSIVLLEIRRNDMLQKFTPEYPPLARVTEELAQRKAAMAEAERSPLQEATTDRNPAYQWLRNESARVRTERDALQSRAAMVRNTIAAHRAQAQRLEGIEMQQQELIRTAKAAEEEYLLYRRKQEETRIADALDQTRIANVAVADAPAVPQRPAASPRALVLLGGLVLAVIAGIGVAWLLWALDPRFRTADDVYEVLDIPLLASLPAGVT